MALPACGYYDINYTNDKILRCIKKFKESKLEEKRLKKTANSFMKNVVILIFSQLLIKVLGLVYKLVITNVPGFGDTGLGYYSAGYQIYALLLTLSSIGIPSVISKLVSERVAIGDTKGADRIFRVAFKLFTTIGFVLSIGLFLSADFIATNILNVPDVAYVMKVLSPAIVFVAMSAVLRGYFSGQQNMKPTSVSQTLEQFLNCVLSITFVYACIGKDTYIMAAAGNLSTTCAIVITFVYLIMYFKKNKLDTTDSIISPERKKTNKELIKTILGISIPIAISSLISVISGVIDTATVSNCMQIAYSSTVGSKEELEQIAMSATGILSKVDTLVSFPLAINLAFSTALTPAISEALAKNDKRTASRRLSFSFFASLIIILPCAIGFIALSEPILKMLYPTASDGAGVFMIASVSMILTALSQTLTGGLYGVNQSKIPAIAAGVGAVIKFILNMILISNPKIGIYGASISSFIYQIIVFFICYNVMNRCVNMRIKFKTHVMKPVISALGMGLIVFGTYKIFNNLFGNTISTIISIAVGAISYCALILFTRVLTKEDIMMIPYGSKIYELLVRMKIYTEE